MKLTPKQLKRQRKREFKAVKKANRLFQIGRYKHAIKKFLDEKEANLDNTPENAETLQWIWQTLEKLDKMTLTDLENFCLEFNIPI